MDAFAADNMVYLANVSYHAWWPSALDPYYVANITENRARIYYYGADYTPHYRMDGVADGDADTGSWPPLFAVRKALDSPLTITRAATYNPVTRTGVFSATITNVSGVVQSGNFRMATTESDLYWVAPNGTEWHNFVMRDMVPDAVGTAISLNPGQFTVINQAYALHDTLVDEPDNCQIVVWVQKVDKEVLQSARIFLPVDQPEIGLAGTVVDDVGGDGDGRVDVGEAATIVTTLANVNPVAATGVTGTLTTTDPYITITDGTSSFGSIPGDGSADNSADPFDIQLAAGAPSGYTAAFVLNVSAGTLDYTKALNVRLNVGSPGDHIGPAGVYYCYENTDPYTESPVYSWAEVDSFLGGGGQRTCDADDVAQSFRLPFTFKYYGVNYDTLTVSSNGLIALGRRISTSAWSGAGPIPGTTGPMCMVAGLWCDLNPVDPGSGKIWRKYEILNHRYVIEYNGVHHYSDIPGTGQPETFEIILLDPAYYPTSTGDGEILIMYKDVNQPANAVAGIQDNTRTVGIQYSYFGSLNPAATGITDLRALKYTPDGPVRTEVPTSLVAGPAALLAASPNPFSSATAIRYQIPQRAEVALHIYGVDGRLVRTLFKGEAEAGAHQALWDGRDSAGHPVASGLYFSRLETGSETKVGKLMLMR